LLEGGAGTWLIGCASRGHCRLPPLAVQARQKLWPQAILTVADEGMRNTVRTNI